MKIIVWTTGYNPWIMGGDVNAPVGFETDVDKPVSLGKGFKGYVVKSPNKKLTVIAEATTGAIIGSSLATVRKDVKSGEVSVMKKQVADAAEKRKRVNKTSPENFWLRYKHGKGGKA